MKSGTKSKTTARADWPFALPADGWHQLMPRGRHEGKDELTGETITQAIDQEAIDSILRDFRTKAAAENFAGVLIDYDHFSEDQDKPTVAAGWITELAERSDGIWFRARWSAEGESNLKSGCYRQISPSLRGIYINDSEVRPVLLDRAGLTNDPRFKNMRPLSNRGGEDPAHNSHKSKETPGMKKILALLGLSADATEDSAAEALTTLINRDKASEADLATMTNRAETAEADLATAKTAAVTAEADAFCDANKAVIKDRDAVHAQYIKDPDGTKSLIGSIEVGKASLKNRRKAQPGKESGAPSLANSVKFEQKVQEYKSQNRCSYQQAFDAAAKAHPELLKEEPVED